MSDWLVGCGTADVTGEPWGNGMLGYGMAFQKSEGLSLRQRSRAFAVVDRSTGRRLVLVVADIGMFFANVRQAVLARLAPDGVRPEELLLTATHTHAGAGGYSGYAMYNRTGGGQRSATLRPLVDGVVASVQAALADLAPGRLVLSQGSLLGASANRSPGAFDRNPQADRDHFPDRVDPTTTLLRLERDGRLVGAVNWFATHGTSLTNRWTLLSGDNKGHAAQAWEAALGTVVTAFAQTNAGDMSPNVPHGVQGPTADELANARAIGGRQLDAARALADEPGTEVTGGLDVRLSHVDLPGLAVAPPFTPDGRTHRLGGAVLGAAFAAGTKEGPGVAAFAEGVEGNRALSLCSGLLYAARPGTKDAHWPKAMLLPVGALGWHASRVPVHLVRLGPLVLVGLAQEVTITAGLRLRRAVAGVLDVPLEHVLVQGYTNDYAGYVTTPEEYAAQRYEGGHTAFGRWELPAYLQEVTRVATDLRDGRPSADAGPPRLTPVGQAAERGPDPAVTCTGWDSAAVSDGVVRGVLVGDDPRGPARPHYVVVEREQDGGWAEVARDGDGAVAVRWARRGDTGWTTTVTWPVEAEGRLRLVWTDRTGRQHQSPPVESGPV